MVLSLDEKSQIQALDRTQPGLPIKPERCQTMTHDYKRHGTTTLFPALGVLDGRVIGRCMQRHRHLEFIRFFNTVEREVLAAELIHTVLDNYIAHKHPKVLAPIGNRTAFRRALATAAIRARRSASTPPMTAMSRSTSRSRSIGIIQGPRWAAEICATTRISGPRLTA